MKRILPSLITCGLIWAIYLLKGGIWFRAFPVVMTGLFLVLFAGSLAMRRSLIQIFAESWGDDVPPEGVIICRRMTKIWALFMLAHFLVTFSTLFLSDRIWAFYNGFLAYILMGLMMAWSLYYRRKVKSQARMAAHG